MDPTDTAEYDRWTNVRLAKKTDDSSPNEREALLGPTEKPQKEIPYPKSVFLIFLTEFCERFSYFGMRAVLILYLTTVLGFSDATGTIIYHTFIMLTYFFPLLFGMLADSSFGKFRTILYLAIVYSFGNIVISLAATPALHIPAVFFSLLGLVLQSIGAGGIKSCVASFGGDQFQLPEQEKKLDQFFFVFYFSVNCGAVLSQFITPILRNDVSCFGSKNCYTLAFGFPGSLMLVAAVIFLMGSGHYKIKIPKQNIGIEAVRCITHAISNRNSKPKEKNAHWLDAAGDVYDQQFITDLKQLLNILILFIPFPIFWALFEQQGSTWTLQATKMNGYLGDGLTIEPDQMQMANPFLILILVPFFERVGYPLLAKCGLLKTYLQRMTLGAFLAALAFLIAGVVEVQIEASYPKLPSNIQTNLNFINTIPCNLKVSLSAHQFQSQLQNNTNYLQLPIKYNLDVLMPLDNFILEQIPALSYQVNIKPIGSCVVDGVNVEPSTLTLTSQAAQATSILIDLNSKSKITLDYSTIGDDLTVKSNDGIANLRVLHGGFDTANYTLELMPITERTTSVSLTMHDPDKATSTVEIEPAEYSVLLHGPAGTSTANSTVNLGNVTLKIGGSYLLALFPDYDNKSNSPVISLYALASSYSISMLLLLPQYIILTVGEVLFAVTGYTLAYTQAPKSMKAIIMAVWIFTDGVGSLIVILATAAEIIKDQAVQFFIFSSLMFLATMLFILLAIRYKPFQISDDRRESQYNVFALQTQSPEK